jgi:DNA-binding transcriptional LysR family regulator
MLDGVSSDQLRTFIAAADEGSFSAAGRRLKRAQSVVSQTLANLEGQLGVKLFDRSARSPVLTEQGRALLSDARKVTGGMELLKTRAKALAGGLEPELSVVVDAMFPVVSLISSVAAFQARFPATALRLYVDAWSGVLEPVLDGRCSVGIMGFHTIPPLLTRERLLTVSLAIVVSPRHPLASHTAPIPAAVLAEYTQIVHTDRADLLSAQQIGPLVPRTWFLSHLGDKLAFLRAGLGFGDVPLATVEADLASGALVQIRPENTPPEGFAIAMSAVYRTHSPPGPAGRWFIDRVKGVPTEIGPK